MSDFGIELGKEEFENEVAQPEKIDLRIWAAIIEQVDHFVGCDSVGQHFAYMLKVPSVAVVGSTFPENVSYDDTDHFQVLDVGAGRRRYDPIRLTMEEEIHRSHDGIMTMADKAIDEIVKELEVVMNKGAKNGK